MRRYLTIMAIPAFVLAGLVLGQCSKKCTQPAPVSEPPLTYPMSIGSHWTYEVTRMTTWARTPEDTVLAVDTVTVTIVDTTRLAGTGELAAVYVYDPFLSGFCSFRRYATMYVTSEIDESNNNAELVRCHAYATPTSPWLVYILGIKVDRVASYCGLLETTGDTTIAVPAGTFEECMTLQSECRYGHGGIHMTDWFRPYVGIVRSHHWLTDSDGGSNYWRVQHTWTLLTYHIAEP